MDARSREALVDGASRLGVDLDPEALARFGAFLSLLQLWGRKINLTARLEDSDVVTHHFLDSLAGARTLALTPKASVIDIGSGAGLPGFPLKFAFPDLRVTLVDSVRKKIAFCQEVIRVTRVSAVDALWGRGEDVARLPGRHEAYDWVVSRALGRAANVVRLGLPFLAAGGQVLLYKGSPDRQELDELEALCAKIQASWELSPVSVPYLEKDRSLVVVRTSA